MAIDAVPLDQLEYQVGDAARELDQPFAPLGPVFRHHLVRVRLQPRDDLPAGSPRRAPAGLPRLQQDDVGARLGQMQRRRKPGKTGAHDNRVGPPLLRQHRRIGRRRRGRGPERIREGLFSHVRRLA